MLGRRIAKAVALNAHEAIHYKNLKGLNPTVSHVPIRTLSLPEKPIDSPPPNIGGLKPLIPSKSVIPSEEGSASYFLEMSSYIVTLASELFHSSYFNVAAILQIIGVGNLLRLYTKYEGELNRKIDKLLAVLSKGDRLIVQIQETYHDAYTVIKKEDRMNVAQINRLESDLILISKELEEMQTEFSRMRKRPGYIISLMRRSCETHEKLARVKISCIHSYYHIANSVFYCHIKSHQDSFESIAIALQYYLKALKLEIDAKPIFALFKTLTEHLERNDHIAPKQFETFIVALAGIYREEQKAWFSDLLNYIGYVLFDSLDKKQTTNLTLYPLLFLHLACQVNPENYIALNNIGFAYAMLGHLDKAQMYFEKSIKLNHRFPLSHFNLANVIYIRDKEKGKEFFRHASRIMDPHFNGSHNPINMTIANRKLLERINVLLGEHIAELETLEYLPKDLKGHKNKYILVDTREKHDSPLLIIPCRLYYINPEGHVEEIKLRNSNLFRQKLKKFKKALHTNIISLNQEEFFDLVTSNGGYTQPLEDASKSVFEHTIGKDPIPVESMLKLEEQFVRAVNYGEATRFWSSMNPILKASFLFHPPQIVDISTESISTTKLSTLFYEDIKRWRHTPGIEAIEQIPIPNRFMLISDRTPEL